MSVRVKKVLAGRGYAAGILPGQRIPEPLARALVRRGVIEVSEWTDDSDQTGSEPEAEERKAAPEAKKPARKGKAKKE